MAFAATAGTVTLFGNRKMAMGGFTQVSSDTGGAIATGLATVDYFDASYMLTTSDSSGTVTITTADPGAAQTGYWIALGT